SQGAASVSVSGGTQGYTYTWSTTPQQTGDTVAGLTAGVYMVTVHDSLGCSKNATVVIQQYPQPVIDAGPDQTICPGAAVTLQATGGMSYTWGLSGTLSCIHCSDPVASPADSTLYTVTGTDANGCVDSDDVLVTVQEKGPVAAGPDAVICEGGSVVLHAEGGTSYQWIPADGLSDPLSADPAASPQGSTNYSVIIRQEPCFADTLDQGVQVYPLPTVSLGPDHYGVVGALFQINAQTTNAVSIAWEPATGLSCSDCNSPTLTITGPVTYTATVSNEIGCKASDDISITAGCESSVLFMPNTFTPNGDGNNDLYYPMSNGVRIIKLFRIYDRWGELLYEARDIMPNEIKYGWNGTYKGEQLKPDVYVWYVEAVCLNEFPLFIKGDVSLVR
ncbi:MAG: T9SS type B sorting domain-containing protein, partial [Sphingobacteriales bacterium]